MSGELERMIAEMRGEIEKLRKYNSEYKEHIHTLRKRTESMVVEMEGLRSRVCYLSGLLKENGVNE